MTLAIQTDRTLIRAAASSTRYVLASITAPRAPARATRLPVNIGIVLDRSGSMASEQKFGLAREAVEQSLQMLRPEDRFSLVVYDDRVDVLMPSSLATPKSKRRALAALHTVSPRGSTDLGAGWLRACEQIAEFLSEEAVSRCLLLTDGLANQGITDRDELARHAGELRQRGVSTSTFGVGADFDERLLRDMAHEGGGNFYFIEGASQIPGMLTGELGEALEVTLRNASLVVTLPSGATAESLNRFRQATLHDRNQLRVELGDLVSAQQLGVVVKITFTCGEPAEETAAQFALASGGETVVGSECRQSWTYATHHENDLQPRNREVDRAVAELYAARARAEATEANREGRYDHAQRVLDATANRIRAYAGNDTTLQHIARGLNEAVIEYAAAPMTAMALKRSLFASELSAKGRDESGHARRSS
jgi:Ca-activated chloride channel family protein